MPSGFDFVDTFSNYANNWTISTWANSPTWSHFRSSNVEYSDDKLKLKTAADATAASGFSGAEIMSKQQFGYGLFEVSMKPTNVNGLCNSFFTYNSSTLDEIDVEFFTVNSNDTKTVHFTAHKNSGQYANYAPKLNNNIDASLDFHKYAILYTPAAIYWYVDGELYFQCANQMSTELTNVMFNLWTNTASGWGWMGTYNGTPAQAEYEWFRYKALATSSVSELQQIAATGNAAEYTVGLVTWNPSHSPFQEGLQYTASVVLTALSGYSFAGLASATINGQTASVSGNTGATVTLSYEFPAAVSPSQQGRVVAYLPAYRAIAGGSGGANAARFSDQLDRVTDIILAFAVYTDTGEVRFPDGRSSSALGYEWGDSNYVSNGWANPSNIGTVVSSAHSRGVSVSLAIGGWGPSSPNDTTFASAVSSTHRSAFIANIMSLVNTHNLDGVDVDWEYPQTPQEKADFEAFMVALKAQLGSKKLSHAISASYPPTAYSQTTMDTLDVLHLMTYDGQSMPTRPHHADMTWAKGRLDVWMNSAVLDSEKVMFGIPFYGRWPGSGSTTDWSTELDYATLINPDPAVLSQASQTVYSGDGLTYYYDGIPQVLEKTEYAWNQGAGGVMVWDLGQDVEPNSPYSVLDKIHVKSQELITNGITAPTIQTSTLPGGTVGTTYSQVLTANGDAPITWSVILGSLPGGLSLTDDTISGTPSVSGVFSFTVQASNAGGADTAALSITIKEATPNAGISYIDETLTGLAAGSYSFGGASAVVVSGATYPLQAGWFGTSNFTIVKVGNGGSSTDSTAQMLEIPARPGTPDPGKVDCTDSLNDDGKITDVDSTMEYKLSTASSWTSVTNSTVTGLSPGTYEVRVSASDSPPYRFASTAASVTIDPYSATAPSITTASLPDGTVDSVYSQNLSATGDAPITWSIVSGSLPDGLSLSDNTISGTPTAANNFNFTVQATNSGGLSSQALSITIGKASLTVTKFIGESFTYNGIAQGPTIENAHAGFVTISEHSKTNAGDYTATASLINKANYQWSNDTTTDITFPWSIVRAERLHTVSLGNWTLGQAANDPSISPATAESASVKYEYSRTDDFTDISDTKPSAAGTYWVRAVIGKTENYVAFTTAWVSFEIYQENDGREQNPDMGSLFLMIGIGVLTVIGFFGLVFYIVRKTQRMH